MIGDVVGKLGRRTVRGLLPEIRRERAIDLVIANGENAAGGRGLTPQTAEELFSAGVDIITSGNHVWENREIYPVLDSDAPIVRPLNYPEGTPGRGVYQKDGVAVVNLMGRTFMGAHLDCPFRCADRALAELHDSRIIIVDLHAEATSEKIAMGFYLDGRVAAVVGTHTHVPTADERVLPGGTAYITDVGMTGPYDSVIGVKKELIVGKFLNNMPVRFEPATGDVRLCAVVIDGDETTGKSKKIERLMIT